MNKVLHVFYSFLPDLTGSSIRSSGLLAGQIAQGMRIAVVSSPFQPGFGAAPVEEFLGVKLYRAHRPGYPVVSEKGSSFRSRLRKVALFPSFVVFLRRTAKEEGAAIIHAHSTFYCALAGFIAARLLGIKVVYEFRSLWEERARQLSFLYRAQARVSRFIETLSLRIVDRVVTINDGLKAEIVSRGIAASRVDVVPNAVDDALIERGRQVEAPSSVTRFGYIGNLSSIEGLDLLVKAFESAFPNGEDVQLLFHGAGPYEPELSKLVRELGDARIQLRGKFARDAVAAVYQSVDCVVLPRRRLKINETVTPLKPLEAMAFKRVVGISDVRGLVEVAGGVGNVWMFKADDVEDLANGLRRVFEGRVDVKGLASKGYEFVLSQRAWSSIARAYVDVYAKC